MAILTQKMQRQMYDIQCAAATRSASVRAYVANSFAAVPYLVRTDRLGTRKEVHEFIDMVANTTDAYINTR